MRLIDADALLMTDTWTWYDEWGNFTTAGNIVKNAPTIDAEPVVRCRDCRYWNSETKGCKRNPSVEAWYETDFCSYGERREP